MIMELIAMTVIMWMCSMQAEMPMSNGIRAISRIIRHIDLWLITGQAIQQLTGLRLMLRPFHKPCMTRIYLTRIAMRLIWSGLPIIPKNCD